MKKNEYAEKLKDPRWQKKRLEILKRDDFTCQWCFDNESTLHVHHLWYVSGDPWDAPDEALLTVCETCHEEEATLRKSAEDNLIRICKEARIPSRGVSELAESIHESGIKNEVNWTIMCWGIANAKARETVYGLYFVEHRSVLESIK